MNSSKLDFNTRVLVGVVRALAGETSRIKTFEIVVMFLVLIIALILAVVPILTVGIDNFVGLAIFLLSFLIASTEIPIWVAFEFVKTRDELSAKIKDVSNVVHQDVQKTVETVGLEYTPTPEDNWGIALHLMKKLKKGDIAYDVSSHRNRPEFDEEFLKKLDEGVTFYRIVCFDARDQEQEDTKLWFHEIMNCKGNYDRCKKAMEDGRLVMYHIPEMVSTDFFVIERRALAQAQLECIVGFMRDIKVIRPDVYTSGFYISKSELADDFKDLFLNVLRARATKHFDEQILAHKSKQTCCPCFSYYDCATGKLKPLAEEAKPRGDKGTASSERTQRVNLSEWKKRVKGDFVCERNSSE